MSNRSKTVALDVVSYPNGQALLEAEAGRIFLHLEDKTYIEVAYLFGLDRYYANEASMRSAITRAYNLVLDNPKKYDIPTDKVAFIQGKISSRYIARKDPETVREQKELEALDISKAMLSNRDLAASLVRKKLEHLNRNPKSLKDEKLRDLAWVLGVLFDKGQIIQGNATEHIAVMSNIPDKIDPEEAMKIILKMRDELQASK